MSKSKLPWPIYPSMTDGQNWGKTNSAAQAQEFAQIITKLKNCGISLEEPCNLVLLPALQQDLFVLIQTILKKSSNFPKKSILVLYCLYHLKKFPKLLPEAPCLSVDCFVLVYPP